MPEELTQAEKLAALHNDRLVARTYLDHARAAELEIGGRYAAARAELSAVPVVPRLPAGHWGNDPLPRTEPPLGWSVDEMPVVGEPHEVERAAHAERAEGEPGRAGSLVEAPSLGREGDVEPKGGTEDTLNASDATSVPSHIMRR
jgi:hypothetical protein